MNILVDLNHPAHVHFFRHFISEMEDRGHNIIVTASKKEITFDLLEEYRIEYINLGSYGKGLFNKMVQVPIMALKMVEVIKKHNVDILMGVGSSRIAHSGFLTGKKSYVFTDTEHATMINNLFRPFASKIMTPDCFTDDFGEKQVRYKGYQELAYLHSDRFQPNPKVLKKLGLGEKDKFFLVRFVSWDASHDVGQYGFTENEKKDLIRLLNREGRVILSCEGEVPTEFEEYQYSLNPIDMHDILYYADMYIGESGTMSTEAACLGTPVIYVNTLGAGTFQELEEKYKLFYKCDGAKAIELAKSLLGEDNLSRKWRKRQAVLLNDKIDVTQWMVDYFQSL